MNNPFLEKVEKALQADRERRNREQLEEVVKLARRGGARPGAGRPRSADGVTIAVYLPTRLAECVRRRATDRKESVSRYVTDALQERIDRETELDPAAEKEYKSPS